MAKQWGKEAENFSATAHNRKESVCQGGTWTKLSGEGCNLCKNNPVKIDRADGVLARTG